MGKNENEAIEEIIEKVLRFLDIGVKIEKIFNNDNEYTFNIISEEYSALLIGKNGRTLDSLQHIVSRVFNGKKNTDKRRLIEIDINGYKKRRKERFEKKAEYLAKLVLRKKAEAITKPFNADERKLIHKKINSINGVTSYALGNGFLKRIIISPMEEKRGNAWYRM